MDTSVKNLISMGPLEDSFIYYDLKNQVFYGVKQGMNYSAIAAPYCNPFLATAVKVAQPNLWRCLLPS